VRADPRTLAGRECGTSLCCKVAAVEEVAKPNGVWCPHCVKSKKCMIYTSRPQSCRDFARDRDPAGSGGDLGTLGTDEMIQLGHATNGTERVVEVHKVKRAAVAACGKADALRA
jgi:hypothetical protein